MSKPAPIPPSLQQAFRQLIAGGCGWQIKSKDQPLVEQKIQHRMAMLNLSHPEAYYHLLTAPTSESRQEWQHLIALLTNPESFFFRDRGQFKVLRNHVLPDLIKRHQSDKQLRILSAGCSTGEEAYSLALTLKNLMPDIDQWQVTLLGTDINTHALKQAKAGIYRPWSLRGMDAVTQQQFFRKIDEHYHLDDDIKTMVRFRTLNLVGKTLSQPKAQLKLDLIICRNVFIYFSEGAIASVIDSFYKMLRPSGYLITGHTELWNQDMSRFETQSYPESLVYQRPPNHQRPLHHHQRPPNLSPSQSPQSSPRTSPELPSGEDALLDTALSLFKARSFDQAMPYLEKSLKLQPQNFDILCLMAQLQLKIGQLDLAAQYCRQASEIEAFSVMPYYTLAQVLKRQGNRTAAKRTFKKILYLEPTSVAAYVELSRIYRQEGNAKKSLKMRRSALSLLRKLPVNTKIFELDDLTVAELLLKF
ncbi:MAG: CheR family methyltransferase [Cyanobacteria bacterium P01_D01_bin.44]